MKKIIRTKLAEMDSEKLIEIIDLLCDDKATERKLSLLVNTSSKDIERALYELDGYCERYRNSPDSNYMFEKLCSTVDSLFIVAKHSNTIVAARIFYEMLQSFLTSDLLELYDDALNDYYFCAKTELTYLIKNEEKALPAESVGAYKLAVDFDYE